MRIALGQLEATDDKQRNLAVAVRLVEEAASRGAHVVVLPEEAMYTAASEDRALAETAEDLDGPFVSSVQELADKFGLTIIAGIHERAADESFRAYNTVVVVDPGGDVRSYRKIHLSDVFGNRESDQVVEGEGALLTCEVAGVRIGILNCYDIRFPELARLLIDEGAEVLVVSAAWIGGRLKEEHWETLLRARAIENTCWVAAADQSSDVFVGRSMLIDPMGVVRCALGEEREALVVGDVDRSRTAAVREANPSLRNRRFAVDRGVMWPRLSVHSL